MAEMNLAGVRSYRQKPMKRVIQGFCGALLVLLILPFSPIPAAELPVYSRGYSPQRDPFTDGRDALALAQRTGRRVLIEVGS